MPNKGYSALTIGDVTVFFDPDSFSVSNVAHLSVVQSLNGVSYFHFFSGNDADYPSVGRDISISGSYETLTTIGKLKALMDAKTHVPIIFHEGAVIRAPGLGIKPKGLYVITNFTYSPMKPGLPIPYSDRNPYDPDPVAVEVRFSYTMTLSLVSR